MAELGDRSLLRGVHDRIGLAVLALVGFAVSVIMLIELGTTLRPLGFSLAATLANGLSIGSVYALIALGVALVYRATKVINFAQGELGSLPALVAIWALAGFSLEQALPEGGPPTGAFVLVILGAVVLGAVLSIGINLLVIDKLANASPVTSLVATTGIALLFVSFEAIVFDVKLRGFPRLIDGAPAGFELGPFCFSQLDEGRCLVDAKFAIGGLVIPWNTFLIIGVLAVVSLALAAFFRSPAGVALLATSQDAFAAELYGVSPRVMSSLAWGIAGGFAALAGILGAGFFGEVSPGFMTTRFLVPALVAAVLGGLTSMVGAVAGGLLIGVVYALANSLSLLAALKLDWQIPGPPQLGAFVVLILTLLLRPRGLFGRDA